MEQTPRISIPLWADDEIDTTGWDQPEGLANLETGLRVIRNVSRPSLTAFLPDPGTATGTSVVIAPGGAYHFLAFEHEGTQVAEWLNERGIAAFLLKYRLVQTGDDFPQVVGKNLGSPETRASTVEPVMPLILADGCRAVKVVRQRAADWGLDPRKVGMMGFSAGGMATLSVALHARGDSRPDFAAPIYSAPPLEGPVPGNAAPLFLACAADDDMASAVSLQYYTAWRIARRPVELHIYAKGGHGFGMTKLGLPSDGWIERFGEWLKMLGF